MADINTTISVEVTGADELTALASAAERAATALDKLEESAGKGVDVSAAGGGADKFAAMWEGAIGKVQSQLDDLNKQLADIGKGAAAGSDAATASLAKIEDAEKAASEQADAMAASMSKADDAAKGLSGTADASAASVGKLDDSLKGASETSAGLKDTAAGATDGIKGLGAGADISAAQMAEFNKVMADSAAMQADTAKVSADASLAMARSSQVQSDAKTSLATTSVEQDAAMAQSAKVTQAAHDDAAASAEATAGKYHMLALGSAAALAVGIDMAAKLQTSVTRLYTTAGESAKNLPMMAAGILALSGQTNTSQAQLGQGAYMVESAGYHGQDALGVLKAAAEGAQSEGAPLSDTANALTSLMNAYGVPKGESASRAAMSDMDQIIAMVSRGKMTMAGAVGALPDVLPAASAAKLSFADVGGALSTMTSLGVSPDRAAQNLSHVITSIMNPNAVQTKEQQQLGLNPVQIQNDLGKQGLTGTLEELSGTVMKSMGPAGDVLFKTFNQSKSAAADAQTMINAMPSSIRGVAQAYADGTVSAAQWNQEMFKGTESAQQKNMLQQFATVENTAKGFNDLLKTGAPDVQTYAAAMDKLLGGQTGLNVAMELTGQHMPVMKANTDAIAASAQHAGDNVTGWSKVQGTLNFQLGSFTKTLEAVATEAGQTALPALTDTLKVASSVGSFLADHPALAKDLTIGGGILGAAAIIPKLASVGGTALSSVGTVAEKLNIPGLDKLANIGNLGKSAGLDTAATSLGGAATDLSGAGTSLGGAAADLSGAAQSLKEGSLPAGEPGKPGGGGPPLTPAETSAAERDVTTGAEEAGGAAGLAKIFGKGSPLAGLGAMAGPVAEGLAIGMIIKGLGDQVAPKGSPSGNLNEMFQRNAAKGGPGALLHPNTFGGFEGWLTNKIGEPVGGAINNVFSTATPSSLPIHTAERGFTTMPSLNAAPVRAPAAASASTFAAAAPTADLLGTGAHPSVKVSVDTSALDAAKGKIQSDIAGLGGHPSPIRLPAPDVSALAGARSQVQSDIAGLGGHPSPVKLPAPDLSALASAKGAAAADGAAVGAGFASGIASETGAAAAAGASLASAAEAAMKVHLEISSPSKVTEAIGKNAGDSFASGITSSASAVKAAAASIGSDSVASLIQGLEGGQSNQQNAATALTGALANPDAVTTIQQTIQELQQDIPAGQDTGLVKWLNQQQTKLSSLADKQGALMTQITDAQQVATSAIGNASIMSAGAYEPAVGAAGGPQSSVTTLTGLTAMLADQKQFASQLTQLQKEGLNATTLSQLAQGGATAGLPITSGLAGAGKGTIAQLNADESQIIKASQQIGTIGGTSMYQAGLAAGNGLAAGLKGALKSLDKVIAADANEVIAKVQKELGTKAGTAASSASSAASTAAASASAPSSAGSTSSLGNVGPAASAAASGLGKVGPEGGAAAAGLGSVASAAGAAASGLGKVAGALGSLLAASQPSPGSGHAQPMGGGGYSAPGGGGGGSGEVHYHNNTTVHVHGSLVQQQDLADHMQAVTLQKGANNWQMGNVYPGRAF